MFEMIYYYFSQGKFLQELGQLVTVPIEWVLFHYTKVQHSGEITIKENMGVENRDISFGQRSED